MLAERSSAANRAAYFDASNDLRSDTPTVLCDRESGTGDRHAIIGLARINEIAARTLVAWLRADSGATRLVWNWQPGAVETCDQELLLDRGPCEGAPARIVFMSGSPVLLLTWNGLKISQKHQRLRCRAKSVRG
jgi:hypothetical protein